MKTFRIIQIFLAVSSTLFVSAAELSTKINETAFNQIKSPFFYSRNIITTVNENIADFDIYDIEGRLLKVAYQVSTVDISDLNAGIYLIKMNMSGKLFIEKIVKNHYCPIKNRIV